MTKRTITTAAAILAGGLYLVAAGPARAADLEKGKKTYEAKCLNCHGAEGKGDGKMGKALKPPASDLTKSTLSDADFLKIVKEGGKAVGRSPLMNAQKSLSDEELADLQAYARSLKK